MYEHAAFSMVDRSTVGKRGKPARKRLSKNHYEHNLVELRNPKGYERTFGEAEPAAKRLPLTEKRGDARYVASVLRSALSLNYGTRAENRTGR